MMFSSHQPGGFYVPEPNKNMRTLYKPFDLLLSKDSVDESSFKGPVHPEMLMESRVKFYSP